MRYAFNVLQDPNLTPPSPQNQIEEQKLHILPFSNYLHSRTHIYPQNYSQEMVQNDQEQALLINSTSIRSINVQQRWENPVTKQLFISLSRRISLILMTQIFRVRLFSPQKYEAIASLKTALKLWKNQIRRKNNLSQISNFRILCFLRVILHKFHKLNIQRRFQKWKKRVSQSKQNHLIKQLSQIREPYDIESQVIRTQASINARLEQNLHSFYNAYRLSCKLQGVYSFENVLQKIKRNIAYRAFFSYSRNSSYHQFKNARQFQAAQSVLRQQIQILQSQVENSQIMQMDLHQEITTLSAYSSCGDCQMMRQRILQNQGWEIDHQRLNQVINSNNNSNKKHRVMMIDSDLPFQQYYNNQFNRQTKSSLDGQFIINSDSDIYHQNMILSQNDQNISSNMSDNQQQILQHHPYMIMSSSHSNTAANRKNLLIDIQANQIPNSKGNKHPQSSGGINQSSKHIINQQLRPPHQQSLSSSSSASLKNQQNFSNQPSFQQRNKISQKSNRFTPRVGDPVHNLATMTSSTSSQQKQNIQFSPGIIRPMSTLIVGEEDNQAISNERRENKLEHNGYQPVIAWEQHQADSRKKRVLIDSSDIDNVISDSCKEQELITEESEERLSIAAMSDAFQGDSVGLPSGGGLVGQNDLGRELVTFVQQQNEDLKKMLDQNNEEDIGTLFKDDEEFIALQGKLIQLEKEVKNNKLVSQ